MGVRTASQMKASVMGQAFESASKMKHEYYDDSRLIPRYDYRTVQQYLKE